MCGTINEVTDEEWRGTRLDLNLLTSLRALLEEESVTRAAARMGLKQPAMSTALARLRRRFNDELLTRGSRGYVLTPFAKTLLPRVQESVRLLSEALELESPFDPRQSDREFRLMSTDYGIAMLHEPLITRLRELAPAVRLHIDPLVQGAHETDRYIAEYDALIAPLGYRFRGLSTLLWRDRMVLLADPRNRDLRERPLSMDTIRGLSHATASFGEHTATPVDRYLEEHGLRRRVKVIVDGWLPLPHVIRGTNMVALMPERLARIHERPRGHLMVLEPPNEPLPLLEGCWYGEHRRSDTGHAWLLDRLAEVARDFSNGP